MTVSVRSSPADRCVESPVDLTLRWCRRTVLLDSYTLSLLSLSVVIIPHSSSYAVPVRTVISRTVPPGLCVFTGSVQYIRLLAC